jgi:hypothetical protein
MDPGVVSCVKPTLNQQCVTSCIGPAHYHRVQPHHEQQAYTDSLLSSIAGRCLADSILISTNFFMGNLPFIFGMAVSSCCALVSSK